MITGKATVEYVVDASAADQGVVGSGRTLKAYVDAIGTVKKATIKLVHKGVGNTTTYALGTSETITDNITLDIENGAIIDIAVAQTLTINGPLEAGLYQVFSGAGSVSFAGNTSIKELCPLLWGIIGDGITDNTMAINAMTTAAATPSQDLKISWPSGKYKITNQITIGTYDIWEGTGQTNSYFMLVGANAQVALSSYCKIVTMGVIGDGTAGQIGFNTDGAGSWCLDNIRAASCDIGIDLKTSAGGILINPIVISNQTAGIRINAGSGYINELNFVGGNITTNEIGFLVLASCNNVSFDGTIIQASVSYGIQTQATVSNLKIDNCHIESNGTAEISIESYCKNLRIVNNRIDMEDTNGKCIEFSGAGAQKGIYIGFNRFSGGDADDYAVILGNKVYNPVFQQNEYDDIGGGSAFAILDNSRNGYLSIFDNEFASSYRTPVTLSDANTTPDVNNGNIFFSGTTGVTITRFDNGKAGQEITIISKGVIIFDTSTATRLIGSAVDITTASGDITTWVCEIGGSAGSVWRLKGFVDVSVDNSAGA